jgi:hypothetical protein
MLLGLVVAESCRSGPVTADSSLTPSQPAWTGGEEMA